MTEFISILPQSGVPDRLQVLDAIGILPVIDRNLQASRARDIERLAVDIREVGAPDLFRPFDAGRPLTLETLRTRRPERIRLVISPACWLDFALTADPLRLQAFLAAYSMMPQEITPVPSTSTWSRAVLDDTTVAWAPERNLVVVVRLWSRIVDPTLNLDPIEMATTARVYGNKVRLAPAIGSLARAYLPDGARIVDLMCGSGIVSRVLSSSFDIVANDVNPWAATLARLQLKDIDRMLVERFVGELEVRYAANFEAGETVLADELRTEAAFLYGPVDSAAVKRYREFCAIPLYEKVATLAKIVAGASMSERNPALLTVALFANAYFGVRQSLAIDSIRRAIAAEPKSELREVWLGCLLLTATVCGSGPHFAQPPKIHSERAMRELLEHRSRDVLSEFTQLLRLLAERPTRARVESAVVLCGDWKQALTELTAGTHPPLRAAYVDPPYTRLQYARYYHVLNTLIDYRFSAPVGVGRYAVKEMRPSSKFDGRERSARTELDALLASVARHGLVTFLSYSSSGMVSLPDLCHAMEERFRQVDAFTVPLRHHSQGRRTVHRGQVDEFVLVGIP